MADESVFRVPAMDIQQNWQEVLRYTLTMRVVSPAVLLACISTKALLSGHAEISTLSTVCVVV